MCCVNCQTVTKCECQYFDGMAKESINVLVTKVTLILFGNALNRIIKNYILYVQKGKGDRGSTVVKVL